MSEPINDLAAHLPETRVEPAPAHLVVVSKRLWKLLLVIGGAIWILAAAVTEITDDHVLVPLVINLGSFLVPITMVAFALSRRREGFLTIEQIALAFLAAGTLGVMTTALLEIYLLPATTGTFIGVGIIEEIGKGAVLVAIAYLVPYRDPRNGMVLGAIVGAGFAAFESAGYAISTLLDHLDASPIVNIMETEATRALLAPFGHITWTALTRWRALRELPERVVPRDVPVGLDVRGRRRAARAVGSDLRLVHPVRRSRGRGRLPGRLAECRDLVQPAHVRGARALQRLLQRPARDQRGHRHGLDRALVAGLRT